jgi:hypothetical protein
MKTMKIIFGVTSVLVTLVSAHGQGSFQNLDFEMANPGQTSQSPFGYPTALNVPVAEALPYWNVYDGNVEQSTVNFNNPATGSTAVTLVGEGWPGTIDGNFSVLLQGGGTASAASITQTGTIPVTANTLLFKEQSLNGAGGPLTPGGFTVSIGNQSVPFVELSGGQGYYLYGCNISAWAGQTEQLTLSSINQTVSGNLDNWIIDDISFSPNAVPEPSPFVLSGIAGLAFAGYRRIRHR